MKYKNGKVVVSRGKVQTKGVISKTSIPSRAGPVVLAPLHCRTNNKSEETVIQQLLSEGWKVVKRGWPDLIASKGSQHRLIEIKKGTKKLSKYQLRVVAILKELGMEVEVIRVLN